MPEVDDARAELHESINCGSCGLHYALAAYHKQDADTIRWKITEALKLAIHWSRPGADLDGCPESGPPLGIDHAAYQLCSNEYGNAIRAYLAATGEEQLDQVEEETLLAVATNIYLGPMDPRHGEP